MSSSLRKGITRLLVFSSIFFSFCSHAAFLPSGFAKYSEVSEDLFLIALFIEGGVVSDSMDMQLSRMEFKFLKSRVSNRRFIRILLQNASINNSEDALERNSEAIEAFISQFKGGVRRGDHLVLEKTNAGFKTLLNSVELGEIESADLYHVILNVWIGPIPPSRQFKEGLLGITDNVEYKAAFGALSYSDARRESVAAWLEPEEAPAPDKIVAKPAAPISAPKTVAKTPVVGPQPAASETTIAAAASQVEAKPEPLPENPSEAAPKEIEPRITQAEIERLNRLRSEFALALVRHTQQNIVYPRRSQALKHTGNVRALVTINRTGKLIEYVIEDKAKYESLNRAVEKALKRSQPYPDVPSVIEGDSFTFQVPIAFALSG